MKKVALVSGLLASLALINVQAETGGLYLNGGLGYVNMNSGTRSNNSFFTWKAGAGYVTNTTEDMRIFWGGEGNLNNYGYMWGLEAVGILGFQMSPLLSLFAKAGGNYSGLGDSQTSNNLRPELGAGVGLQLTPSIRATGEANYVFIIRDLGFSAYTLNLQYTLFNSDQSSTPNS